MLGSYTVGNATILRFYVVHVLGLPLLASIAMMVHFWRVRKDGFSGNL
jgi:quinol-cytochrome oxidoreductase complex cytochrome b subunit